MTNRMATAPPKQNGSGVDLLILNAGSSSLKFGLFTRGTDPVRRLSGVLDRIGSQDATFTVKVVGREQPKVGKLHAPSHASCLNFLFDILGNQGETLELAGVGHRVVHGGPNHTEPQIVTSSLIEQLESFSDLAPEHLPAEIALMSEVNRRFPLLRQVACFDTAFHHGLPRVSRLLPIPLHFEKKGIRRYGFHGLSYEFLMQELVAISGAERADGRTILAHLGNGASLAAVHHGACIDTSMSFTPAAGLVMGRRSGDLDPGLAAYLAANEGVTSEDFYELVNHKSGLLGLSETSSDMRDLLAIEDQDPRAFDAVQLFCYQVKKWIGAYAAALGGLDTLVFSGGIGENSALVRSRICEGLSFLGIHLNSSRNGENAELISTDGDSVAVYVIRTDEELVIARTMCRIFIPAV